VGDTVVILRDWLGAVTPTVADGSDSSDTLRTTVITPVVLIWRRGGRPLVLGVVAGFVGVTPL